METGSHTQDQSTEPLNIQNRFINSCGKQDPVQKNREQSPETYKTDLLTAVETGSRTQDQSTEP